jgi:hypothetical protein
MQMLSAKPRAFQPVAQASRARSFCVRPSCSRGDAAPADRSASVDRRSALALLLGSGAYACLQPGAAIAGLPAQVGSYLPPYGDGADDLVLFVPDSKKTPVRAVMAFVAAWASSAVVLRWQLQWLRPTAGS